MFSNNYRKRHHLVKITRHWKISIRIKISDDTLKKAFGSVDELNKLVNYIRHDIDSQLRTYNWYNIEEVL